MTVGDGNFSGWFASGMTGLVFAVSALFCLPAMAAPVASVSGGNTLRSDTAPKACPTVPGGEGRGGGEGA